MNPYYGYETGNVLQDPILPAISGGSFLKWAVATGVVLWLFRKAFR